MYNELEATKADLKAGRVVSTVARRWTRVGSHRREAAPFASVAPYFTNSTNLPRRPPPLQKWCQSSVVAARDAVGLSKMIEEALASHRKEMLAATEPPTPAPASSVKPRGPAASLSPSESLAFDDELYGVDVGDADDESALVGRPAAVRRGGTRTRTPARRDGVCLCGRVRPRVGARAAPH